MIYCVLCANIQNAHRRVNDFIRISERNNSKHLIKEVRRYRTYPVIILAAGTEIHFVSNAFYSKWCKGRTYKFFGDEDEKVYHSGAPAKNTKHRTESD